MRRIIYPLTLKEIDRTEIQDSLRDEECRECKINEHLKREYCSIGICVKEDSKNIEGER